MKHAGLPPVVVVAHEVIVRMGGHVGGGDGNVLIAGDVYPRGVVHLVIHAVGDGKVRHVALAVIHHGIYVRREDGAGVFVHGHGGIGPPQEGLHLAGAVEQLVFDFQIRLAGAQGEAAHALGAEHLLDFPHKDGAAAVRVFRKLPGHGVKGTGAVVLGPVELDAPGNPRPGQAHHGGLDDMVVVDKIIAVGLVQGALHPPAQLRQHHHIQVLVFQAQGGVGFHDFFIADGVGDGMGIHLAAGALVHPAIQKHGVAVGFSHGVSGDVHLFHPNANRLHGDSPPWG